MGIQLNMQPSDRLLTDDHSQRRIGDNQSHTLFHHIGFRAA